MHKKPELIVPFKFHISNIQLFQNKCHFSVRMNKVVRNSCEIKEALFLCHVRFALSLLSRYLPFLLMKSVVQDHSIGHLYLSYCPFHTCVGGVMVNFLLSVYTF